MGALRPHGAPLSDTHESDVRIGGYAYRCPFERVCENDDRMNRRFAEAASCATCRMLCLMSLVQSYLRQTTPSVLEVSLCYGFLACVRRYVPGDPMNTSSVEPSLLSRAKK